MWLENYNKVKVLICDSNLQERIFNDLKVLPINEYKSKLVGREVCVYIKTKKLEKYMKENKLEVLNEQ